MVEAESPPAFLPSNATSASSKSPVETPPEVEDWDQPFEAVRSARDLRLDSVRQQYSRAVAQNLVSGSAKAPDWQS
jgi:hypothetical protein